MLVETLAITVGGSVAKSLLKLWMKDEGLAQDVSLSLTELAQARAKSFFERKGIERTFDRVAEEVAKKLAPFLEAEFSGEPENDLRAAVIAVQETIDSAPLDAELLLANDLEPIRLEAALRAGKPNAAEECFLSEAGTAAYNYTLREAVNYITELSTTLPNFQARATREMLERETKLLELVEKVLANLPENSAFGTAGDPDGFEVQYRREIARKLDRLELFGLRTDPINQRYGLSVAYIGLTASTAKGNDAVPVVGKDDREPGPVPQTIQSNEQGGREEFSIEELLGRGDRTLIRGEAGSGKTTLLQWLAVTSARRRFKDQLEEWNDLIPFFIQLRRHVGESLPQPGAFPYPVSAALAERVPDGWVASLLDEGRALILVDGVDELPEDEREKAAEWLRELINLYPNSKYVITSRPPAVSEDWLEDDGFTAAFLEPMEIGAIDEFITHWHEAAKENAIDDEEVGELDERAEQLKSVIREAAQIRNLATSPLLCAMLCALNRDRKAQLPRGRVELYKAGLEMLLERRDLVRVVASDGVELTLQQKEVLLQGIAYWLLLNGFSDATTHDIEHLLIDKVEALPKVDASPHDVLSHLLIRSGLLREPVEGRIDFIHRTFQEYLTAKQVVDERSLGLLIENAHEDQWQEVVVLAAGQGVESFSQSLIRKLLDRGYKDKDHKHRLQLLAVACLDTTPTLPKELQDELQQVLRELVPPRSMSEARAIASAGEVAVPLLAEFNKAPVAMAAPCARALGLIGGNAAMAKLEVFGPDPRVTVARELLRSWDFFPTDEYAERVLRDSVLNRGSLAVRSAEEFASIPHLKRLTDLECLGTGRVGGARWDWQALAGARSLKTLGLHFVDGPGEFPRLADGGAQLQNLALAGSRGFETLSFDRLPAIETLRLLASNDITRLVGIDDAAGLSLVEIDSCASLRPDFQLPDSVEALRLTAFPIADLWIAANCSKVSDLRIAHCPHLEDISTAGSFSSLSFARLADSESIRDLSPILGLPSLKSLMVQNCPNARLDDLASSLPLLELAIRDPDLASVMFLEGQPALRSVRLAGCRSLSSLDSLANCEDIENLSLIECRQIESLEPLRGLKKLKYLDLEDCRSISDLQPLADLPALRWVDINGCRPDLDLSPIQDTVEFRRGRLHYARALDTRRPVFRVRRRR